MRPLLILLLAALPGWPLANTYVQYKDWSVYITEVDTGQDLRRTCSASTGGDGLPRLSITTSNGDAGPPLDYPAPLIEERAPRGYGTQIQPGDYIIYEFDDGSGAEATLETGYEEGVFPFARVQPFPREILWMLQSMRSAQTISIYRVSRDTAAREPVTTFSLAGFTAAYLKMIESCGHIPGEVIR
ncbi:hypothetical protein [uncultured Roseobacter sp.]|uniref:hypothetical protein n=1 Tax=uncultured Roseobacter sp. TaxID=114847 RepID=UPI002610C708|nr:hypothetical protein [uncultured Roseobacter sp.]